MNFCDQEEVPNLRQEPRFYLGVKKWKNQGRMCKEEEIKQLFAWIFSPGKIKRQSQNLCKFGPPKQGKFDFHLM